MMQSATSMPRVKGHWVPRPGNPDWRKVYASIVSNGTATSQDIADEFGISLQLASAKLTRLHKDGLIVRTGETKCGWIYGVAP